MRRVISVIFILIGVLLLLVPFGGKLYNDYQQKKMMEAFEKDIELSFQEANEELSKLSAHPEQVSEQREFEISDVDTNTNQKIDLGTVIGILSIEKLKINLPIMEGVSEKQLSKGIGHMPATAVPGEKDGNSGLAGHRGHTFSVFFSRLNEMKRGDHIHIRMKDKLLKYEVYEQKIIEPDDFSVLNPKTGQSLITLITCHPLNSDRYRLIVHAKLIEENHIGEE